MTRNRLQWFAFMTMYTDTGGAKQKKKVEVPQPVSGGGASRTSGVLSGAHTTTSGGASGGGGAARTSTSGGVHTTVSGGSSGGGGASRTGTTSNLLQSIIGGLGNNTPKPASVALTANNPTLVGSHYNASTGIPLSGGHTETGAPISYNNTNPASSPAVLPSSSVTQQGISGNVGAYNPVTPSQSYDYGENTALVNSVLERLQGLQNNAPTSYTSPLTDQINQLLAAIQGRGAFSYDLGNDAQFKSLKNMYGQQARKAMEDTMAQAATLTGGYGNSYGQTVGAQAYQGQINDLINYIPQLYQLALQRYESDGNNLFNQLGALQNQEQVNYGQYRDQVGDYNNNLQNTYNEYRDARSDAMDERNYQYAVMQDALDRAQRGSSSSGSGSGSNSTNITSAQATAIKNAMKGGNDTLRSTLDTMVDSGMDAEALDNYLRTQLGYDTSALTTNATANQGAKTYGGMTTLPDGTVGYDRAMFQAAKVAAPASVQAYKTYEDYLQAHSR